MNWKPSTINLLPEEFVEVVAKHKVAVFHIWAAWNAYDKLMDAALRKTASEYKSRIFLGSINADEPGHMQRCKELGVVNLPAIASFVNGMHVETIIGLQSNEDLNSRFRKWLNAGEGITTAWRQRRPENT